MQTGQNYTQPLHGGRQVQLRVQEMGYFYIGRGRAEDLMTAIAMFSDRMSKFEVKLSDRMGERVMPGGRDWKPKMSDAEVTLDCNSNWSWSSTHQSE